MNNNLPLIVQQLIEVLTKAGLPFGIDDDSSFGTRNIAVWRDDDPEDEIVYYWSSDRPEIILMQLQ
jgi:hypothetical protein